MQALYYALMTHKVLVACLEVSFPLSCPASLGKVAELRHHEFVRTQEQSCQTFELSVQEQQPPQIVVAFSSPWLVYHQNVRLHITRVPSHCCPLGWCGTLHTGPTPCLLHLGRLMLQSVSEEQQITRKATDCNS